MTEITIYPMKNTPDGRAEICEPPAEPDSYDVLVQDSHGDVVAETVDLATYVEALAAAKAFLIKFPDAEVNELEFV